MCMVDMTCVSRLHEMWSSSAEKGCIKTETHEKTLIITAAVIKHNVKGDLLSQKNIYLKY